MKKMMITLLSLLSALVVGICCTAVSAQTTPEITKGNCDACASFCAKTLTYCSGKKGKYAQASTTAALLDCVGACRMASDMMGRSSILQSKAAAICVDACNNCMKSCESFKDDNNMKACADECRKCAGNCQKVASAK